MKELKEKRKKAAERQNVMAAKRHEEEYNEYKDSYKKEKKIVDMCTADLDVLMTKLGLLDEKLGKLGVEFKPFVDLCKCTVRFDSNPFFLRCVLKCFK